MSKAVDPYWPNNKDLEPRNTKNRNDKTCSNNAMEML